MGEGDQITKVGKCRWRSILRKESVGVNSRERRRLSKEKGRGRIMRDVDFVTKEGRRTSSGRRR